MPHPPESRKPTPRSHGARRRVRGLLIFDALRANAQPGTYIVLANNRPAESPGSGANFVDTYYVLKPRRIVRGHPTTSRAKKDADKDKVKKAFGKSAKWRRFLSVFNSDGRVLASVDLDANTRFEMAQQEQRSIQQEKQTDAAGSEPAGWMDWFRDNWKLTLAGSLGAVVILLALYWYFFSKSRG
ncbi:hypothetical protein QKT49_gp270 [Acanthamoeba castellanii medusavirus]|uniref:Uncharacterized protein n=1 Tax=Acanthamoeba castellanii medusavirus J1 TaxID=3114988 RepID=A0A3T1CXD8_9VIRU|nr:hypothetical protein QKT49_gp270 [Acanthamoeba castellanii medusavirus]BBI30493.1 hypothetical protein [Acanthamoeba castellanii medusavirus J1]